MSDRKLPIRLPYNVNQQDVLFSINVF